MVQESPASQSDAELHAALGAAIERAKSTPFPAPRARAIGGGSISESLLLEATNGQRAFVKLNTAAFADAFAAEEDGLRALGASGDLVVPRPVCRGQSAGRVFLVLECLDCEPWTTASAVALGRGLASLHQRLGPRFGWHRDNWIGASTQCNEWDEQWCNFLRERRLGFQLGLARKRGYGSALERAGIEQLLARLPSLLGSHQPQPSLVHGDLWSGNVCALHGARAAIFDPAVHYADREVDLAMSEMFGGFPAEFYAAYRDVWPLDSGYTLRRELYNLYHLLNHLNLFGASYLTRCCTRVQQLLAAVR